MQCDASFHISFYSLNLLVLGWPHGCWQVHGEPDSAELRGAAWQEADLRGPGRGSGLRVRAGHHRGHARGAARVRRGGLQPELAAGLPLRPHHAGPQQCALQGAGVQVEAGAEARDQC